MLLRVPRQIRMRISDFQLNHSALTTIQSPQIVMDQWPYVPRIPLTSWICRHLAALLSPNEKVLLASDEPFDL